MHDYSDAEIYITYQFFIYKLYDYATFVSLTIQYFRRIY